MGEKGNSLLSCGEVPETVTGRALNGAVTRGTNRGSDTVAGNEMCQSDNQVQQSKVETYYGCWQTTPPAPQLFASLREEKNKVNK